MCESLVTKIGVENINSVQLVEIWDDLNRYDSLKHQMSVYFGHLLSRTGTIEGDWIESSIVPANFQNIAKSQLEYYRRLDVERTSQALELLCAIGIDSPSELGQFNIRRQVAGSSFEKKVENWVELFLPNSNFIKEGEIKSLKGRHYGGLRITKYTPDILFEKPVHIGEVSADIRWIEIKKQFIDPAFSTDEDVEKISRQLKNYVTYYGKGLVVWSNSFSEEWLETKPNIFHTSLD